MLTFYFMRKKCVSIALVTILKRELSLSVTIALEWKCTYWYMCSPSVQFALDIPLKKWNSVFILHPRVSNNSKICTCISEMCSPGQGTRTCMYWLRLLLPHTCCCFRCTAGYMLFLHG